MNADEGSSIQTYGLQHGTLPSCRYVATPIHAPADAQGFIATRDTLQVIEGGPPEVFAAGDVATCMPYPRPKAGVFAVRAVRTISPQSKKLCFSCVHIFCPGIPTCDSLY